MGGFVGEALGGPLESLNRDITPEDVERAFGMPGGGVHWLAPGQITDDGELTLCLLRVLGGLRSGTFDADAAATAYAEWFRTSPFDVGYTCRATIGRVCRGGGNVTATAMREAASAAAGPRCGNGALMRCSPLAIWGHKLPADDVAWCAAQDALLTHAWPPCVCANACYCVALAHLLSHHDSPTRHADAFASAESWTERACAAGRAGAAEVRAWLAAACAGEVPAETLRDRPAEAAFTLAMRHLQLGTGFIDAARAVMRAGCDTDTNGIIACALVGARVGAGGVPRAWRDAVCAGAPGVEGVGQPRPPWLHPRTTATLVTAVLAAAPVLLATAHDGADKLTFGTK
eukprot:TRINITY_DN1317_c0_g1_i3.p1 TRINITY_DN1317_c0_g1~~TRINITY_DN1317_c0_g1_i3.p1  ORF type:complete len:345 (+),score=62.23 TRINITY_DN1317_c0_g1_i3:594-1628(+)